MYTDIQVSYDELSSAIDYLDINKSCDLDGIYAEHLKFGPYLLTSQPMYVQFLYSWFSFRQHDCYCNQKMDVSCPKTTIDLLRFPVWSAKLLKS